MEHDGRFGRILEKRKETIGWKNYLKNDWLRIAKIKEEHQSKDLNKFTILRENRETTHRYVTVKLLKIKGKDRIFKVTREKKTYYLQRCNSKTDGWRFHRTYRMGWHLGSAEPGISYSAKTSFKNKGNNELYTLSRWTICYMNCISINVLEKEIKAKEGFKIQKLGKSWAADLALK